MNRNRGEKNMRPNTLRLAAAMALASLVFACAAGCQTGGFFAGKNAKRATSADQTERLSDRQVADVKISMARSLEQRGEVDSAIQAYRQAVEKNPQQSVGYWRMAVLNDRRGNVQESEQLYRQALKLDPKNPEIHCDFGYSLYLQRRWAESEQCLREALTLSGTHSRSHNNLGLVLAQTDRLDGALAEFRLSGRQEAEARANLAFVLTMNRRWDEARQQYEIALDANPDSAAAKSGLEHLTALIAKTSPGSEIPGSEKPGSEKPDAEKTGAEKIALASYERPADSSPAPSPIANSAPSAATDPTAHAAVVSRGRAD
jgi:Tfp pilus assembly protein PilF